MKIERTELKWLFQKLSVGVVQRIGNAVCHGVDFSRCPKGTVIEYIVKQWSEEKQDWNDVSDRIVAATLKEVFGVRYEQELLHWFANKHKRTRKKS